MSIIFWAVMVVLFVIAEIVTVQLVSVWLAVGAFITLSCVYFFNIQLMAQLIVFIVSSAVFLAITFPILQKRRNKGYIPTNAELETGKKAVVIEEINQDKGTGRVTLSGVDWSAVSLNGDVIPKDSIVIVDRVQGAKLVVHID